MSELSCCEGSSWVSEIDLDRADGFELDLGRCNRCGTPWMSVWCAGSGVLAYEPVTGSDAERIRALTPGPELRAFMKAWVAKNT
jgi:hypothetical protein